MVEDEASEMSLEQLFEMEEEMIHEIEKNTERMREILTANKGRNSLETSS